jgi:hypothetical protein
VRIHAASLLLDRAYGKPAQMVIQQSNTQYVVFAPAPVKSTQEWLEQARANGIDVPTDQDFDCEKISH